MLAALMKMEKPNKIKIRKENQNTKEAAMFKEIFEAKTTYVREIRLKEVGKFYKIVDIKEDNSEFTRFAQEGMVVELSRPDHFRSYDKNYNIIKTNMDNEVVLDFGQALIPLTAAETRKFKAKIEKAGNKVSTKWISRKRAGDSFESIKYV